MSDYGDALEGSIGHVRYDRALEDLREVLSVISPGGIVPLLGPTRVGKSDLIRDLKGFYGSSVGPRGMLPSPDFCVGEVPAKPNDSDLFRAMLDAVEYPAANSTKLDKMRSRLVDVIRKEGIKFIALDEVSHCAEKGANLSARAAADHFKSLVDNTGVTLILSGLPRFQRLIDENEQLRDRASRTIQLLPYNWSVEKDRDDFVAAIFTIFMRLHEVGVELEFDELDMSRRLYGASGGRVGQVLRILRSAIRLMKSKSLGSSTIAKAAFVCVQQSTSVSTYFEEPAPEDLALTRAYVRIMAEAGLPVDPSSVPEFAARLSA